MTRSPLQCCTSIIRSSALVQVSSFLSIGRPCSWPLRLPVTEMHLRHFFREFNVNIGLIKQSNIVQRVFLSSLPYSYLCIFLVYKLAWSLASTPSLEPTATKDRHSYTNIPITHLTKTHPPLGKLSKWPWLYPPSTPHSTRAAHLHHPFPKKARLWGAHCHRTG